MQLFPMLFVCANHGEAKVVDMGFHSENSWWWDIRIVDNQLIEDCAAKLEDLFVILCGVEPNKEVVDSFVWWWDKNGFSVKTSYQGLTESLNAGSMVVDNDQRDLDNLWKLKVSNKIQMLGWKLLQIKGITSGNDNLVFRLCFTEEETTAHMFLVCPFVVQL